MPALSPDRSMIAFSSGRGGGNNEIYLMASDGSSIRQVTTSDGNVYRPSWSPDGKRLVYANFDSGELLLSEIDGSAAAVPIDGNQDGHPALSPDGTLIAFDSTRSGKSDIYVIGVDGTHLRRLTKDPDTDELPSWSPDGKRILFTSDRTGNGDIYVMDADGSGVIRLTRANAKDEWASWSPDGRQIIYNMCVVDGQCDIHLMNSDGSADVALTHDPSNDWGAQWR